MHAHTLSTRGSQIAMIDFLSRVISLTKSRIQYSRNHNNTCVDEFTLKDGITHTHTTLEQSYSTHTTLG